MDELTRQVIENAQRLLESQRRATIVHSSGEEHYAESVNGEAVLFFPTDGLIMQISDYQFKLIINEGVVRNTNDFAIGQRESSGYNKYPTLQSWLQAYPEGAAIDQDGYYGAQCWDYAAAFWLAQTGRTLVTGGNNGVKNAWLLNASLNAGSEFEMITTWSQIRAGDWVVWTNAGTGHIAMAAASPSGTTLQVYDQNSVGAPYATGGRAIARHTMNQNDSYGTFVGAFRYKAWN